MDSFEKKRKGKTCKGDSIDSLLGEIDQLTSSLSKSNKHFKKGQEPAKNICRVSSFGYRPESTTARRPSEGRQNKRKDSSATEANLIACHDSESFEIIESHETSDIADSTYDIELEELLASCDELIKDDEHQPVRQSWYERTDATITKWENMRQNILEHVISSSFIKDGTKCSMCHENDAIITCKQCRINKSLCFFCDDLVHSLEPCHDRSFYHQKHFKKLTPTQGISAEGMIIDVVRHPKLHWPEYCPTCKSHSTWQRIASNQPCIVVNHFGRFDLFKFTLQCSNCLRETDIFRDVLQIISSRFWPGTIGTITYIFDEDLLSSWDCFQLRMPGSAEHGFLNSLNDISLQNNRIPRIQREAFSQAFKEYRFLQYELKQLQGIEPFQCPSCHIEQHAAMFDGNMKAYRYKTAGRRMRDSYYKDKFFCKNEVVDALVSSIYKESRSFQCKEAGNSICGSSSWLAARNIPQKGGTRDETGLELVSCRHCIAQKALNMFRGEIYGYAYFLQKNIVPGIKYFFCDVACRYWKWLQKVDPELHASQIPAIGMLHVKGHPPSCEVLYGSMWKDGCGYTIGEEDEQVFSYLSRTAATTKYMCPERREESITEFAISWNERKIANMANFFCKRFSQVRQKLALFQNVRERKIKELEIQITDRTLLVWMAEAKSHAQASQNLPMDADFNTWQEFILIFMKLKQCNKVPKYKKYPVQMAEIISLNVEKLKLRLLNKPLEKLVARFNDLLPKLLLNPPHSASTEFEDLASKLLCIHQKKIEAIFYCNLHISQSIGRLADTCKKRRQLRRKVSDQKEHLKALIVDYNRNLQLLGNISQPCSDEDIGRGTFPWLVQPNERSLSSESKHELLITCLTIRRLKEELQILQTEIKNYLKYYLEIAIPGIRKRVKEYDDAMSLCSCHSHDLCSECAVNQGKHALALQGIGGFTKQVEKGRDALEKCLKAAQDEEINNDPDFNVGEDIEFNSDDEDDSEDEYTLEHVDDDDTFYDFI